MAVVLTSNGVHSGGFRLGKTRGRPGDYEQAHDEGVRRDRSRQRPAGVRIRPYAGRLKTRNSASVRALTRTSSHPRSRRERTTASTVASLPSRTNGTVRSRLGPQPEGAMHVSSRSFLFVALSSTVPPTFGDVVDEQESARLRVVSRTDSRVHSSRNPVRRIPTSTNTRRTVLYIGGDPACRIVIARIVRRLDNVHLVVTDTGREGRLLAFSLTPSLILLDAHLSDCDARDLLVYLARVAVPATMPVAILSGTESARMRFIRGGAAAWLTKPLNITEVEQTMMVLLDRFSASS